ncbi:hypothetical protein GNI_075680 [Gregarina niphandrodes]|uniref:Uncharacterized protein n=1 Tax=Gregarina niphandrodes TaxID=110365 RepID=A0A023B6V0_GRENI|nr:hypothetical protein GNI_075680 [Gregarina niphandrodes]EZG66795.1 hypothetical protein GNI_075680 [Gregarina niphandrodes]|eukprot:XP_011130484.1 hypothetical protein GNI_075680 [Gregarina niphandrodes]
MADNYVGCTTTATRQNRPKLFMRYHFQLIKLARMPSNTETTIACMPMGATNTSLTRWEPYYDSHRSMSLYDPVKMTYSSLSTTTANYSNVLKPVNDY